MRAIEPIKRKWSKQIKTYPVQPEEMFDQAAADGLDMIELRAPTRSGCTVVETDFMADPETIQRLSALSRQIGIELAYHAPQGGVWNFGQHPFEISIPRLEECVVRSASLGARIMTVHLGLDPVDRVASLRNASTVLQAVAPFANRQGVLLCVENVFADHSVVEVADCAVLFEGTTNQQVRFTLDTGHAHMNGCLFEMLDSVHNRLAFTHLHDNDGIRDQHLVPGNGTIDWQRFMQDLDRYGYSGPLNFELRKACDFARTRTMLEAMS